MNSAGGLEYLFPAALAAYYACAWLLVGRRRGKQSVVVRYHPPENLSPAAARYVYDRIVDGRTYAAILAQLAAKRFLAPVFEKDSRDGNVIYLEKLKAQDPIDKSLAEEERLVFKKLFEWEARVRLQRPDLRLVEQIEMLIKQSPAGRYFRSNLNWVVAALVLSGVAVVWFALHSGMFGPDVFEANVEAGFSGLSVAIYGYAGYKMWDGNRLAINLAFRGLYLRRTLPLLLALAVLYPALWYFLIQSTAPPFANLTSLLIGINAFFGPALHSYTPSGRSALLEVAGFRHFLCEAEQDRLDRINVPGFPVQMDPEYIPYAIALDVRESWGDQFGIKLMLETKL